MNKKLLIPLVVFVVLAGFLFVEQIAESRRRLQRRSLCFQLAKSPSFSHLGLERYPEPPAFEGWVRERVAA